MIKRGGPPVFGKRLIWLFIPIAYLAGLATPPPLDAIASSFFQRPRAVQCAANGRICVGMSSAQALDFNRPSALGGMLSARCGKSGIEFIGPAEAVLKRDCLEDSVEITFSDRKTDTVVTLVKDRVSKIDVGPAFQWQF